MDKQDEKEFKKFLKDIISSQEEIPDDIKKVTYENFWELF